MEKVATTTKNQYNIDPAEFKEKLGLNESESIESVQSSTEIDGRQIIIVFTKQ